MRIVPNAINPAVFDHNAVPRESRLLPEELRQADRNFVLQVGRIEPVKNQLAAIKALFAVPVPLVFIGARPAAYARYFEQCQALAARRGNVYFVDAVPHEQLPGLYRGARVHMLPSFRETPGLVSLEAALMGCNIVTTDQGPTDEYFGPWAWYCNPTSLDSIRRAVLGALAAPFPEFLRQRIRARFTWHNAAQATLAAYRRVLESRL
jgi:glycosyltransferase involved in cell wall biosynthesis